MADVAAKRRIHESKKKKKLIEKDSNLNVCFFLLMKYVLSDVAWMLI